MVIQFILGHTDAITEKGTRGRLRNLIQMFTPINILPPFLLTAEWVLSRQEVQDLNEYSVVISGLRKCFSKFILCFWWKFSLSFLSPFKHSLIPILPQRKVLSLEDSLPQSLITTGHDSFFGQTGRLSPRILCWLYKNSRNKQFYFCYPYAMSTWTLDRYGFCTAIK